MNLILFEEYEITAGTDGAVHTAEISSADERYRHIRQVLKPGPGEEFDAGIVNGPRCKASVVSDDGSSATIQLRITGEPEDLFPLILLLGLSRPQTVKKIIREATALGAAGIFTFTTDKGESGYAKSSALSEDSVHRLLLEGAQQAFCTRLPEFKIFNSLDEAVSAAAAAAGKFSEGAPLKIALDNYEAACGMKDFWTENEDRGDAVLLAVGSERGWSGSERDKLRTEEFTLVSLGKRVLRTETAAVAGTALCLNGLGYY